MHRTFLALIAASGFAITSGCAMCESCFDYTYTARGGAGCWQSDDCCRAGSAFCGATSYDGGGYETPHYSPYDPAIAPGEIVDPVPGELSYEQSPTRAQQTPSLPSDSGTRPPADLAPTVPDVPEGALDTPDTGLPPFGDLELPSP